MANKLRPCFRAFAVSINCSCFADFYLGCSLFPSLIRFLRPRAVPLPSISCSFFPPLLSLLFYFLPRHALMFRILRPNIFNGVPTYRTRDRDLFLEHFQCAANNSRMQRAQKAVRSRKEIDMEPLFPSRHYR